MSARTDPAQFLREIRDTDSLLMALVEAADRVEWHWPTFYLIYVELDRMSWRLADAGNVVAPASTRDGQDRHEDADIATRYFGGLGKGVRTILTLLWNVSRGVSTKVDDVALNMRLQAHLHPKSSWYQALRAEYRPGTVTADGRFLSRTILVQDAAPLERIGAPHEQFLLRHQVYDLCDPEVVSQLKAAADETAQLHVEVLRAYGRYFAAHCTIANLLHPSSA